MGLDLTAYIEYPLDRPAAERTLAELSDLGRNSRLYALMGAPADLPDGGTVLGARGIPPGFAMPIFDDDLPGYPPYPRWNEREDCTSWLTATDMRDVVTLAGRLAVETGPAQRIVDAIDALEARGMACRVFCAWSI